MALSSQEAALLPLRFATRRVKGRGRAKDAKTTAAVNTMGALCAQLGNRRKDTRAQRARDCPTPLWRTSARGLPMSRAIASATHGAKVSSIIWQGSGPPSRSLDHNHRHAIVQSSGARALILGMSTDLGNARQPKSRPQELRSRYIYIYISNKVGLAETMRGVQGLPRCCASLPEKGKIQTKSDGGACFARWRMHNCLFRIKAAAVATLNHAE